MTQIDVTVTTPPGLTATVGVGPTVAVEVAAATPFEVAVLQGGLPGPPGAPGGSFVFDQNVAASTWVVNHGLGYFPAVTVVDTLLREVEADVQHADVNNFTVHFATPNTGHAFVS